jgi:hypothetical protein
MHLLRLLLVLLCLQRVSVAQMATMQTGSNSGSESSAYGSASNQQNNSSGSSSFGGNNNSYQYNTEFGQASEYIYSTRQVRCEGPRFYVGAWADPQADYWVNGSIYGDQAWEWRGGAGVTVPFGSLNQTCQAMARTIERQQRFDTAVGIVRACAGLRRSGVALSDDLLQSFPDLVACRNVAVAAAP